MTAEEVPCPVCCAVVGEKCFDTGGGYVNPMWFCNRHGPHAERVARAKRHAIRKATDDYLRSKRT